MKDRTSASAALLQRLTEEDDSLLNQTDPKIEALLIERLYQNSWATRYVPLPMLFGAFVIYQDRLTWYHIIGLTALYTLGTWYLDRQRDRYANTMALLEKPEHWGLRFAIGSGVTGATWGLIGWFCYPPGDFGLQAILAVAWAGLAISAVNTRAVHLPSFYAFIIAMSVPFYARGFLFGEPATVAMAFLGTILFVSLCFSAQINNRRERLGIALRLRNAELIGQLDHARAAAEANRIEIERAYHNILGEFGAAQRLTQHGSWTWDGEAEQVVWSDEFYRLLGLKPQSCPAAMAAWLEQVHGEDRDAVRGHYQRLRAGATQDRIVFRLSAAAQAARMGQPPGGSLEAVGESQRDSTGAVRRIHGILRPSH